MSNINVIEILVYRCRINQNISNLFFIIRYSIIEFIVYLRKFFLIILAWCLKNENVHCVLLGASSVEQLYENINSIQVN